MAALEAENAELKDLVDQLKRDLDGTNAKLEKALLELAEEMETSEEAVDEAESVKANARQKLAEMKGELAQARAELAEEKRRGLDAGLAAERRAAEIEQTDAEIAVAITIRAITT